MPKEKIVFLNNRHIFYVIGVAQVSLHSINFKRLQAMILKMDLVKDYDKVNQKLFILILLHIGLGLEDTKWIMGCVLCKFCNAY